MSVTRHSNEPVTLPKGVAYFIRVPNRAAYDDLSLTAVDVLMFVCERWSLDRQGATGSPTDIADEIGRSRQAVAAAIRELEAAALVTVMRKNRSVALIVPDDSKGWHKFPICPDFDAVRSTPAGSGGLRLALAVAAAGEQPLAMGALAGLCRTGRRNVDRWIRAAVDLGLIEAEAPGPRMAFSYKLRFVGRGIVSGMPSDSGERPPSEPLPETSESEQIPNGFHTESRQPDEPSSLGSSLGSSLPECHMSRTPIPTSARASDTDLNQDTLQTIQNALTSRAFNDLDIGRFLQVWNRSHEKAATACWETAEALLANLALYEAHFEMLQDDELEFYEPENLAAVLMHRIKNPFDEHRDYATDEVLYHLDETNPPLAEWVNEQIYNPAAMFEPVDVATLTASISEPAPPPVTQEQAHEHLLRSRELLKQHSQVIATRLVA